MFISYGHADAETLALRLEADLTRAGFDVWLDKSKLRAGRSWEEQIEREILSRQVVVSLLTPHAVRRPDGEHARLLGALRPLDFGVEVSRLTRHFTGRQWLFDEIEAWLQTDTTRLFLITGDPGTGKSAIMARLIARHPSVCASHLCISSGSDSLSPFRFACSVAAQLATQLDDYRMALDAVDLENLHALAASSVWRRVIVVDAPDEAMGVSGGSIPRLLRDSERPLRPDHAQGS